MEPRRKKKLRWFVLLALLYVAAAAHNANSKDFYWECKRWTAQ